MSAANVVISFDHMKDSVELCQRFGRARQEDSSKVVMDERRDRGVTRLQQVKQRQNGIIQEFDPSKVSQSQKTDMAAQKSREKMRRVFYSRKIKGLTINCIIRRISETLFTCIFDNIFSCFPTKDDALQVLS